MKAEIKNCTASIKVVVEENKTIKANMAHLEKELKKSLEKVAKEKRQQQKKLWNKTKLNYPFSEDENKP